MVVKVDEYARIRHAHAVEKVGIRELARRFHHSRRKIREILGQPEPRPYPRRESAPSILDPFKPTIDAILKADEKAPRKQRHTAAKIFRRLRDEHGYQGGEERVRLYLRGQPSRGVETFIPLNHDPGQRAECDFGHIYVDFPDGRQQVPVLLVTWGYSNCPFAIALPTERTEAILHGLVEAFTFFGAVPHELWWDNPTTVAALILKGRERRPHERYQALASHYCFAPLFCLVRRPQEKPRVEGRVRHLQRDWATPVPVVKDLAELNAHLLGCCRAERDRIQAGQTETIGQRFARDTDHALSLPPYPFDPCIAQPAKVDKYQTVRFDGNSYSVPRRYAFRTVTVKGYVNEVVIVVGDQVVARHPRLYGRLEQNLDPLHYLEILGRKPAALDHANVFRHWQLPAIFHDLRADLERQHGRTGGVRHFVRVLQLLGEGHTTTRVQRAVVQSHTSGGYDIEAIVQRVRRGTLSAPATAAPVDLTNHAADVRAVQVPPPDLRVFDLFLTGEKNDVRPEPAAGESQPETTSPAGHVCRVREIVEGGGHGERELRTIPLTSDGTGSGGPIDQCPQGADQTGELPHDQGFRHLRLQCPAVPQQAEGARAGAGRMDRGTPERLPDRLGRDRQDSYRDRPWSSSLSFGEARAFLYGGSLGQPPGGIAKAIPS